MKATVSLLLMAALVVACSGTRPPPDSGHSAAPAKAGAATAATPSGVDRDLVRQGYRVGQRNGQIVYCREQVGTGTRFASNVCLTADQLKEAQRKAREDMQRIHQNGCVGSQGCGS
jgi:hypothetical protein